MAYNRAVSEEAWRMLEAASPGERQKMFPDGGPRIGPRLAGYVAKQLRLDPVTHFERFTDVPVPVVHRLKVRFKDATTDQARTSILMAYQNKHKKQWVNSGWKGEEAV